MKRRHTDDEVDLPDWVAVLDPGQRPLDSKELNKDELTAEFEKRFVALLQKSGSENSLDGWRDVAIDLALEFHPAFKIKEQNTLPVSGRPIKSFRWSIKNAFLSRKRKLNQEAEEKAVGTATEDKPVQNAAQAAREVAQEWAAVEEPARARTRHLSAKHSDGIMKTPIAKTIENMASERIPFPAEWSAEDYRFEAKWIARAAARRITEI
jgi:hypothetical protein